MYNLLMLKAFISWWYAKGWAWKAEQILQSLERTIDYFSLGLLLKTWFAPFRQIDAGKLKNASLEMRMRKFFDRTFSRFMGAMVRTVVMLIGVIVISVKAFFGLFVLIFWPIMPIFPVVAIFIFMSGWTPQIIPKVQESFNNVKIDIFSPKTEKKSESKNNLLEYKGSDR